MTNSKISIQFTENTVDVVLASILPATGCGGECIFVGRTKSETSAEHGKLIALQYDCYQDMAKAELQMLAKEAIQRFGVKHIQITHSVGRVAPNEASVVIAVSSIHRDDAFTACRFLIDLLKQKVPIWKQEMWADGTTWSDGVCLQSP